MAGIDVVFRFTQTQQVDVARPEPCPEQSASREDSFIHADLAVLFYIMSSLARIRLHYNAITSPIKLRTRTHRTDGP